jgi:hypothetical protein
MKQNAHCDTAVEKSSYVGDPVLTQCTACRWK